MAASRRAPPSTLRLSVESSASSWSDPAGPPGKRVLPSQNHANPPSGSCRLHALLLPIDSEKRRREGNK